MVKVTLEIPEELLGHVYMAVGKVLRQGYQEEPETELAPDPETELALEPETVADADETGA